MRDVLGGKGAGLAEMSKAGVPVPPGFTISTEVCNLFFENDKQVPKEVDDQIHQALHIPGRRPTLVDDEVRMSLRNARAPDAGPLQSRDIDQPAGVVAGGVLEHRARVGAAVRLARHAPPPNVFQPATDGVRCLGAEREAHRRHHEARRQRRTPVAEGERRARQHDQLSPTVEPFDRDRGARDVAAVGAGVHEQCAADGARNALRVLEAREPPAGGGAGEAPEVRPGPGPDLRPALAVVPFDAREPAAELHHHAAHAAVADEHVRAAAEHRHGGAARGRGAQDEGELVDGLGDDQQIRRATDPKRRMAGERLAPARTHPEARGNRFGERGRELHDSAYWTRRSGSPAFRSASSSSAVRWMSPAPRVSTRSPWRAVPINASATCSRAGTQRTSRWPRRLSA